jgi:hypothetical protein
MLNRDFASVTQGIIRNTNPNITAPIQPDWAGIIRQAGEDYNEGKLTQQMIAEHPEEANRIRQMGGRAYADMLKQDELRAEERQQKLDDLAAQRDFQREMIDLQTQRAMGLEATRHANAMKLAEFKAGLSGDFTNAQRNVGAMIEAGYTPQEAWAMYYGGNNPTLNMDMLGKKGQEAYDKKIGETLAGKTEAADLLAQTEQAYNDLFKDGGLIQQAKIGADMPDSVAGRVGGIFDRAVPTNLVDKEAQQARQQIQYILGGLRLDESAAMKGALSDSEQKFLSDMVAGNVKGYSPWEIKGAFEGIMNKLRRKASSPSLKDFQNINEEVIDYTDL